jgi:hypothetical protein
MFFSAVRVSILFTIEHSNLFIVECAENMIIYTEVEWDLRIILTKMKV